MSTDLSKIKLLVRREIEAQIAGPLINGFIKEFGKNSSLKVVREVMKSLARESGANLAEICDGNSLEDFFYVISFWSQDDALRFDILEKTPSKLSMDVKKCRFAEMYRESGLVELGYELSCSRDFALVEGFNSKIKLTRTQTIMEGADFCDFRFAFEG
ncbi:MAG: L-2-amino-thiazoline-4-carboxylic acid hydrolase [Desulfobacterales bacterium]|nr:L-2-amino-thiazoline-4-carboxylic acid hydrolase [Desulfobacterales bacterium]